MSRFTNCTSVGVFRRNMIYPSTMFFYSVYIVNILPHTLLFRFFFSETHVFYHFKNDNEQQIPEIIIFLKL